MIDDALLRSGRLDVQVEIGLPDKDGQFDILHIHTAHMRKNDMLNPSVNFYDLAESKTVVQGEVGIDRRLLCRYCSDTAYLPP